MVKWHQRWRENGSVAPVKMGGHRRFILDPHRDFIVDEINRTPHLTLFKLQDMLANRGVKASHDTVWRFLRREGHGMSCGSGILRPDNNSSIADLCRC
ncbi:MAG: hypothetical protein GY742_00185 [Hyphomicrobiales bacterium]|nr:hypothetical protein [Hyphomicrobiales bacterium]